MTIPTTPDENRCRECGSDRHHRYWCPKFVSEPTPEPDGVREYIQSMTWQEIVVLILAVAVTAILCFSPAATCSVKITDSPSSTSTESDR